ncbi:hypothetical protein D3C81_1334640 [compost metagenome]
MAELEIQQKVLNSFIKEIKKENTDALKEGKFATLTEDQIEVLKEHGLSKDLIYGGVDNEKKDPTDFYIARQLSFYIKGFSSIPTVSKIVDDGKDATKLKKMKGPAKVMYDYIQTLSAKLSTAGLTLGDSSVEVKNFLTAELKTVKEELFSERVKINSMKIAKVLTGDWFSETEIDDKGNETFTKGDTVLVIKRERVEVPITA